MCLLLVIQTVNVIILSRSRTCLLLVIQTVNVIILLYFANDPLLPSTEKYASHCFSDILTLHLGGLPTSKDVASWDKQKGKLFAPFFTGKVNVLSLTLLFIYELLETPTLHVKVKTSFFDLN